MKPGTIGFFIPDELLVLILIGTGIAFIVGARRLAASMFAFAVLSLVLPSLLAPNVESLPIWILLAILGYLIFLIPFVAVSIFQWLVSPALGKRTAAEMGGHLAADVARATLGAPFRLIGAVFRLIVKTWVGR